VAPGLDEAEQEIKEDDRDENDDEETFGRAGRRRFG